MANPKRKTEWTIDQPPATASSAPSASIEHAIASPSPARALQQLLDERTRLAPAPDRWSRRRSLAFIVASSSALWLAILASLRAVAPLA